MENEELFQFDLSEKYKIKMAQWYVGNGYISSIDALFISISDKDLDHFQELGLDREKDYTFFVNREEFTKPYTGPIRKTLIKGD